MSFSQPKESPPDSAYQERYTDAELEHIVEQGLIYMCACPAQVADATRQLRALLQYQMRCLSDPVNDAAVHAAIAKSTVQAHEVLQQCLDTVIALEKWDRATLEMPEGLRQRQLRSVEGGESQLEP